MEALVGLEVEVEAVHRLLVAHDLGKYLESELLVKEVQPFARTCLLILLRQEVEELARFNFGHCLSNENLEQSLNVLELEGKRA